VSPTDPIVGATAGDAAVRALGVVRLALPVPFAEAAGAVNVYLIDNPDGSLTLFDTGLGTEAARARLAAGFAAVGRRLEEVRQVVLSHGHLDHFGGARFVHERSGAPVLVHPADAGKVVGGEPERSRRHALGPYFSRLGVPEAAILRMNEVYRGQRGMAEQVEAVAPLAPGRRLELGAFAARAGGRCGEGAAGGAGGADAGPAGRSSRRSPRSAANGLLKGGFSSLIALSSMPPGIGASRRRELASAAVVDGRAVAAPGHDAVLDARGVAHPAHEEPARDREHDEEEDRDERPVALVALTARAPRGGARGVIGCGRGVGGRPRDRRPLTGRAGAPA
jgi:hypothetical protein